MVQAVAEDLPALRKQPGPPKPFRFTVEIFHRMGEMGMLGEEHRRLELLNGEILELMPIGQRHAAYVDRLNQILGRKLKEGLLLRIQNPVRLTRASEPIPNVSIVWERPDYYLKSPPGPADCALIIEVSDTSLDYDLGVKARTYAEAESQSIGSLISRAGAYAFSDGRSQGNSRNPSLPRRATPSLSAPSQA